MRNVVSNPKFLYSALRAFPPDAAMRFFSGLGVPLKTERGNRVFPVSDKASDVSDALIRRMRQLGVTVVFSEARSLMFENGSVCGVKTKRGVIRCESVVVATGGKSYPKTGSDGSGYALASSAGHTITPLSASLVPLCSDDSACAELQGLSLRNVELHVKDPDGNNVFSELGEMLFTHFGISGPLVLSASARMRALSVSSYQVSIDLKPALDMQTLDRRILRDFEKYSNRILSNALGDLLPAKMIPVIIRLSGISPDKKVHSVTREERGILVSLLKGFPVSVTAFRPVDEAIVTAGGVKTDEVNPRTMESKLVSGLYFAGEVLDLDAYTGGFNLQIAWSTGYVAGNHC